jgi:hypothetical protein
MRSLLPCFLTAIAIVCALTRSASAYTIGNMSCEDYADFAEEIVRGKENGQTMKQPAQKTMQAALAKVEAATTNYPDERKRLTEIIKAFYARPVVFSDTSKAKIVATCEERGWVKSQNVEPSADGKIRQFQRFRLGDFTYEIRRCEVRTRLGSEFAPAKPSAGAVFLVVRFAIANETKKTETVLSDDFTLRDGQGREFSPASNALTALMMGGENKDFLVSEIQPGVEKESLTAFEIPKAALSTNLVLIVPEKGLLGSKTVEVVVKPQTR